MEFEKQRKGGLGGGGRQPRTAKVKNKTAAPIQITAEQILREAMERQDVETKPPRQKINDPEELAEHQMRTRKNYEDQIRRCRQNMGNWMKYAEWEESQREFERCRSIFERAIDVDYRSTIIWLKYAEMEMRNKNVNHARNVWDRAVTLLPRCDQLWYKYIHMEEMVGNYAGVRQVFERWMDWEPDLNAWNSYIKFELRHSEIERARMIYNRFVKCHNQVKTWLKYAKFEEKQGNIENARVIYQAAIDSLGDDANDEKLYISFARLEERAKENERARTIYKYALDHIPKGKATDLYRMWIAFEKQYGERTGIEDVIISKRRFQYEEEIKNNPKNYDVWFDYIRLEETNGNIEKIREVYERAIANIPPIKEKRYWRRYIYLWVNYAIFEELQAEDIERARQVYSECLKLLPHKLFSFAKIWVMFANFEVRQLRLDEARKILGNALGHYKHSKIFKAYINLEFKLGQIDRCRTLYEKFLEFAPENCYAWCKFAEMEKDLSEIERARAIFELAITQPVLDMPEIVWKSYIDFEVEQKEYDRTRSLYRQLLQRTKHVKVWISFAQFEKSIGEISIARSVYEEAFKAMKSNETKDERVLLYDSWKEFEQTVGDSEKLAIVNKLQPQKVKRKRQLKTEDGADAGWEEYYDYIFPDEKEARPSLKILEMAHKWKRTKTE